MSQGSGRHLRSMGSRPRSNAPRHLRSLKSTAFQSCILQNTAIREIPASSSGPASWAVSDEFIPFSRLTQRSSGVRAQHRQTCRKRDCSAGACVQPRSLITFKLLCHHSLAGRARGLMEPLDPRYRKNRCRENRRISARREPAPGNLPLLLQGRQHSPK